MPQKKAFLSFTFKNIKKVEFCFDILEAAFKRFLKSDEKMAFGTNGILYRMRSKLALHLNKSCYYQNSYWDSLTRFSRPADDFNIYVYIILYYYKFTLNSHCMIFWAFNWFFSKKKMC